MTDTRNGAVSNNGETAGFPVVDGAGGWVAAAWRPGNPADGRGPDRSEANSVPTPPQPALPVPPRPTPTPARQGGSAFTLTPPTVEQAVPVSRASVTGPLQVPQAPTSAPGPVPRMPGPPASYRPPQPLPPPPLPSGASAVATPLDHRSIVRYSGEAPVEGWRGRVYSASRGRVNPGAGPAQLARQRMIAAIRRPLRGSHRVAVMSVKGGVGKTTVSACLGLVLAENRGDRVVALDANPDAGTLAERLTGDTGITVRDLLDSIGPADVDSIRSITDVDRFTSLAGRLQVLASEQDPAAGEAFNRAEYERVCAVLARFANIVITDSGTGLVHSAMEGTLALADSIVVVGSPTIDGANRASKTLDWLIAHGHAAQAARALVVLSCDRVSREVDRAQVRAHFAARCRGVVEIPFDPCLATGGRVVLPALRPATIDAFLLLAALVSDGFAPPLSPPGSR